MKKWFVLAVLLCLGAVLGATADTVYLTSGSPAPVRAALATVDTQTLINDGKSYFNAHDILSARDKFKAAVAQSPDNQEANLLYGITRVLAVVEDSQAVSTAGPNSVKELLERSGFSFSTFGLYGIDGTPPQSPSSTMPRTGAILDFIKLKALAEIDGAIGNLGKVTSPTFSSTISPVAMARYYGQDLSVDLADVTVLRSLLNLLKCNLNLMMVYGFDVSIPEIAAAPEQLMTYKRLMEDSAFLAVKDAASLGKARTALTTFISQYKAAKLLLLAPGRIGAAHHLFVVDCELNTNELVDTRSEQFTSIDAVLDTLSSALNERVVLPGSGLVQDRTIELFRFFGTTPINIRSLISDCSNGTALPDATLQGLFPYGVSKIPEIRARYGAHILGVACSGREVPLLDMHARNGDWYIWDNVDYPPEPLAITIANTGTADLHVSSVTLGGVNDTDFIVTRGTCSSLTPLLTAGSSCDLSVSVKRPGTNYGNLSASLTVASDNPSGTISNDLWGYVVPPPGGTISGKVKDAATGLPMSAWVYFSSDQSGTFSTSTDSNGNYSISGMNSGKYRVQFVPMDGSYITQWYGNKLDRDSSDILTLTSTDVVLSDVALQKGGSLSLVVKNPSGSRDYSVWVSVYAYDAQKTWQVASMSTRYDGTDYSYYVEGLPTGSYKIQIGGGSYISQWYNGGAPVQVTAPNAVTLNAVTMAVGGQISGRLTETGTGNPVSWVSASAYDMNGQFIASGSTDWSGYYTIPGLPTGTFRVFFAGNMNSYQNLWYGNTTSQSAGQTVSVTAPNQTANIDMTLARVQWVQVGMNSSANPSFTGQPVTFTVNVSPQWGSGAVPTGTMTFVEGGTVLGEATLDGTGKGVFTTTTLSAGTHNIDAYYSGDRNYSSTSGYLMQTVKLQTFPLTVSVTGSGSVNSAPSGIACTAGGSGCSAPFVSGSSVTLTPAPSSSSVFSSWGGACSGSGPCVVSMDAAKTVTATFAAAPAKVRLDGKSTVYYSLGTALDAVLLSGQTVRAKAETFVENIVKDDLYTIFLKGGFTDGAFATRSSTSFTVIDGSLKIRSGRLNVERLLVR